MEHDLRPHTLERNEWSSVQPLMAVREQMQQCSGTAVVAFERMRIEAGRDHRGHDRDEPLNKESLPTVWNQIEATMAYSLDHPLLVMAERGLRSEGLLESRYDWIVQWLALEEGALRTPECSGVIEDWKRRVTRYRARRSDSEPAERDIADKTIAQLLGELRPGQARAVIAAAAALLVGAFSLGAFFGG